MSSNNLNSAGFYFCVFISLTVFSLSTAVLYSKFIDRRRRNSLSIDCVHKLRVIATLSAHNCCEVNLEKKFQKNKLTSAIRLFLKVTQSSADNGSAEPLASSRPMAAASWPMSPRSTRGGTRRPTPPPEHCGQWSPNLRSESRAVCLVASCFCGQHNRVLWDGEPRQFGLHHTSLGRFFPLHLCCLVSKGGR